MVELEDQKISVVTVSLNQGEFIRANIESVLQQPYNNIEHIIVDGGSTDSTLEVLKDYSHLNWTSEPDNGQCDALNKGFAKATGDIIVWLNSDDFLAPNVLPAIAEQLKHHRVIFTPAGETNRDGKLVEAVANVEKSEFDLLKYWVPYAWVAQTGVFFRRDLLEEVRLAENVYVDESLNFCMDYDLWMRFAKATEIAHPIDEVCAYFRMYADNKTGADGAATQRECSRVYRRYTHKLTETEWRFSIILPVNSFGDQDLCKTLTSVIEQSIADIEIIIVNHGTKAESSHLKSITKEFNNASQHHSFRFVDNPDRPLLEALNAGIDACRGSYVSCVLPGDVLHHDFCLHMHNLFSMDALGLILPLDNSSSNFKALTKGGRQIISKPLEIFANELIDPRLCAKKETLLDLGGFSYTSDCSLGVPHLLANALLQGWGINVNNPLTVEREIELDDIQKRYRLFHLYIASQIIVDCAASISSDSFLQLKANKGIGLSFPRSSVDAAKTAIHSAPKNWHTFGYIHYLQQLEHITAQHPEFAPSWFLLSEIQERLGRMSEAQASLEKFLRLVPPDMAETMNQIRG